MITKTSKVKDTSNSAKGIFYYQNKKGNIRNVQNKE